MLARLFAEKPIRSQLQTGQLTACGLDN